MAAKKHPTIDLIEVSSRLHGINATLQLCAFAAEARRTLHEIDNFKLIFPDRGQELERNIETGSEWREHADSVGQVLKNISYQMDSLIQLVEEG